MSQVFRQTEPNSLPVGTVSSIRRTVLNPARRFPGIDTTAFVPPDPDIAVGTTRIVAVVNSDLAFFTKGGQKLFQQTLEGAQGFFGSVGAGNFVFDPKCFFDPISRRFFVLALDLAGNQSHILVGVSATENPQGNWHKYKIDVKLTVGGNEYWLDYPGWGFNKDAVVCTGNMFPLGSGGFGGAQFVVLSKAQMLTGAAPTITKLHDPESASVQVGETADAVLDRIYATSLFSTSQVRLFALTNLVTNPTITTTQVAVPSFLFPNQGGASQGGRVLDALDGRLINAAWRGGQLVTAHGVRVGPSDGRNQVRWYQIGTRGWPTSGQTPVLTMAGNVPGGQGEHAFMPAVNINKVGDVSLVFTRSSGTMVADLMTASRRASDPPGTMGLPVPIAQSQGSGYGGVGFNRWGDYFGVDVDPQDDMTFWGIGMIGKPNGSWTTVIQSWTVSTPAEAAIPFNATAISAYQGDYLSGFAVSVHNQDTQAYSIRSTPVSAQGQLSGAEITYVIDRNASAVSGLSVGLRARAAAGTTAMVFAYNWSAGRYDHVGSNPLTGSDRNWTTAIPNPGLYINGQRQVQIVVRTIAPVRQNRGRVVMPAQHTSRIDLARLFMSPTDD
jgi:hypothetical protein